MRTRTLMLLFLLLFSIIIPSQDVCAEVIDNSDSGFTTIGDWPHSTYVSGYYGSDYQSAEPGDGSKSATWSFDITGGEYDISAWWTIGLNRAPDAFYRIFNNGVELGTVFVDQRTDGGQFNSLSSFPIVSGGLDVILCNDASGYVIADAVQATYLGEVNYPPNGVIDTPSSDVSIFAGDTVNFTGTGTDPDGNTSLTYLWNFGNGSGISDSTEEDPGSIQFNNPGTFTVTFTVTDSLGLSDPVPATVIVSVQDSGGSVIIDNSDSGFTTVGDWPHSTYVSGYYGSDYQSAEPGDGSKSATWSFDITGGEYDISAWWTIGLNRAPDAFYRIFNNGVELGTVFVDQRTDGGQFNSLSSFPIVSGGLDVILCNDASGYVIADAVQATYLGEVNYPPNGVIDTPSSDVSIFAGDTVNFTGTGTDPDGNTSLTYLWNFGNGSGISDSTEEDPGSIQFNNPGTFTVTFTVTDSLGLSDPVPATVIVSVQDSGGSVIIDNSDSGFTTVGDWPHSTYVSGYYGSDYQSAEPGDGSKSATWSFDITGGEYDISAWWTIGLNRAPDAFYRIFNNGVELGTVFVDQRTDGGQFNSLSSFPIVSGGLDVILCNDASGYVIADAVQATYLGEVNYPPNGVIDTPSSDVSIFAGDTVNFTGTGTDPDGNTSLTYLWNFGNGSGISDSTEEDPGSIQFNNPGTFTVTFTVTDSLGLSDPVPATVIVSVQDSGGSVIIDNSDSGFTTVGDWPHSTYQSGYYGSDYQFAESGDGSKKAMWSFDVSAGEYDISAWWTSAPSRAPDAFYRIFNNGVELGTVFVDQRTDGGQFNLLSRLALQSGSLDIIMTNDASAHVVADAIWSLYVGAVDNYPPNGTIDSPEFKAILPVGGTVFFSGTGTDPDGNIPLMYLWSFGDGSGISDSTEEDPGVVQFNNPGTFTVTFTVTDSLDLSDILPATVNIHVTALKEPIVIDNSDSGFTTVGNWPHSTWQSGYYGSDYQYAEPGDGSETATWSFDIGFGVYEISAWWTIGSNRAPDAPYSIYNNGLDLGIVRVDQRTGEGQFNLIGNAIVDSGTLETVLTDDASGYVMADAVQLIKRCATTPCVSILQPYDHHLQSSNDLYVLAQTYGLNATQTGWGVKFVLDDSDEILDYELPYEAYFQNLSEGEHIVEALLVDEDGFQVPGESTYDQVNNVAVGDYYVAMGDSITDGEGDDILSDDISDDGRTVGGGYPPILANRLIIALGYPQLIVNEGVGGDTSSDGLALLPSILNRYSEAQHYLIQYGTNDSSGLLPIPSGSGLAPGEEGCDGTFKDNMQQIIDLINGEEREACIAKAPIARGQTANSEPFPDPENASKNLMIQEYNAVVDELVQDASNGIVVNPPDFYDYFRDHLWDEYYDNLHPNGIGCQSMADLWFIALTE